MISYVQARRKVPGFRETGQSQRNLRGQGGRRASPSHYIVPNGQKGDGQGTTAGRGACRGFS